MPRTKILVIDDDEGVCEFVKLTLEETRKFNVVGTTSAPKGLRLAELHRPNLVLLDIMMPGMSGAVAAPVMPHELIAQMESLLAVITRQKAFVTSLEGR